MSTGVAVALGLGAAIFAAGGVYIITRPTQQVVPLRQNPNTQSTQPVVRNPPAGQPPVDQTKQVLGDINTGLQLAGGLAQLGTSLFNSFGGGSDNYSSGGSDDSSDYTGADYSGGDYAGDD